jgi:hypothetical protein
VFEAMLRVGALITVCVTPRNHGFSHDSPVICELHTFLLKSHV